MNGTALIVDDDDAMCRMLESGLRSSGHETASAVSADTALELLRSREFDVVITDIRMRRIDGLELCRRVVELRPDVPVIVITAFGSMEAAIEAMRAGAYDFITKPFGLDTIRLVVRRAVQHRALSRRVERLEQALREGREFENLLGSSPPMRQLVDIVERVAPSDTVVLVTGESGTGKELVARALHRRSLRRDGPFVAVNCAALPEPLLESELFGHAKGAFTDAKADHKGLFVQASKGTLFLDEIGELPLALQPKLLRALQERSIRPLGAKGEVSFDARIVAATNRDLESEVEQGRFREDLFYRIHVIEVATPPLRVRGNDILLLAQHFIGQFAAVSGKPLKGLLATVADRLLAYPWPGNVRELQNCIERAVTLSRYSEITVDDLPKKVRDYDRSQDVLTVDDPNDFVPMEEIERRYITRVFDATKRNKSLAAKLLGFNRKTLYRKLRQYGVIPDEEGAEE